MGLETRQKTASPRVACCHGPRGVRRRSEGLARLSVCPSAAPLPGAGVPGGPKCRLASRALWVAFGCRRWFLVDRSSAGLALLPGAGASAVCSAVANGSSAPEVRIRGCAGVRPGASRGWGAARVLPRLQQATVPPPPMPGLEGPCGTQQSPGGVPKALCVCWRWGSRAGDSRGSMQGTGACSRLEGPWSQRLALLLRLLEVEGSIQIFFLIGQFQRF